MAIKGVSEVSGATSPGKTRLDIKRKILTECPALLRQSCIAGVASTELQLTDTSDAA